MADKLVLLAYKPTSAGARMMANALNLERVFRDSNFTPSRETTVLNWGRGDYPNWMKRGVRFINHPESVMNAISKDRALKLMQEAGVPCVEFTPLQATAARWIDEGHIVLCRRELQGFDGSGIVVARRRNQLVSAEIYTKYVRKVNEYRVHVVNGEVIYSNIKGKARQQPANPEPLIRTGSQGWIFLHMDELPSEAVQQASIGAVRALGLDFGGVDIGESEDGTVRVYEVNTAPELGPNTVARYSAAFKQHYGEYKNNENLPIGSL